MIKNIEELNEIIKDFNDEDKKEVTQLIKPFFDFSDFMLKKHGKLMEEVENESAKFSEEVLPEYLELMANKEVTKNSSLEFIIGLSGKIYRRYAEKYDYDNAEEVESSLTKYMEIIMRKTLNNNGNK